MVIALGKGALGLIASGLLLSGCGAVDRFEPKALRYNAEAANTKGNSILLNILRAGHRFPLQFTEYTSAVGQTSVSGQIGATLPFTAVPFTNPRTFSLNPQVTGNDQTQATVQNLNSQEYYNGLQSPLTLQMLAGLIAAGHDPYMVFMLSISSIRRASGTGIVELVNDPASPGDFEAFYDAIKMLSESGLDFETRQSSGEDIGPQLSDKEAAALLPTYLTASATAAAMGGASALPDLAKAGTAFQLKKKSSSFRICFRQNKLNRFAESRNSSKLVSKVGADYIIHLQLRGPLLLRDMRVPSSSLCGAARTPKQAQDDKLVVDWTFAPRSVEGVYNYLGQIVRAQWTDPEAFETRFRLPRDFGGKSFFLLKLYDGTPPNAAMSATLGTTYSVLRDTLDDTDKSTQVVAFLTDLWALESSAKSFPAVSTVAITASP